MCGWLAWPARRVCCTSRCDTTEKKAYLVDILVSNPSVLPQGIEVTCSLPRDPLIVPERVTACLENVLRFGFDEGARLKC